MANETKPDLTGTATDPQPLPGETGAAYTSRQREMAPAAQGRDGEAASTSGPNDPTPLTGVAADEDPLGISTGRVSSSEETETAATEAKSEDKPKQGKLPEDFPGHAALADNDITTYAQARKAAERDQLTEMNGIGPATAERIKAEL